MNKLASAFILLALPVMAFSAETQYGRVVDIKGSGFISYDGKTHEIKKGEVIYNDSEIIIEHSGQVSFTDNADHRFHLGNASSAAVYAGKVELRSGDMWVQSINKSDDSTMTTANATVNFTGGEAILSYDSMKGKTQLMVINGLMKFSNLRAPELNLTVAEGNFSFVDQKFEEGMPRDPTPVGQKTYGELVSIFTGVKPMDAHSAEIFKGNDKMEKVTRGIASVTAGHGEAAHGEVAHKEEKHELKKEEHREVAHMAKEEKTEHEHAAAPEHKTVKTVAKTEKKKTTPVANKLVVKIWGQTGSVASATTDIYDIPSVVKTESTQGSSRMPASVPETETHTATKTVTSTVLDQVVPNDSVKTNPSAPQYKESDKLIEQLNKL